MRLIPTLGILTMVLLEAVEQTSFAAGSRRHERRWGFWALGAAAHLAAAAIWYPLLTVLPLGVAIPMTGLCYVSTALAAKLFLDEKISLRRWAAIGMVCGGVLMVYFGGVIE